MNRIKRFLKKFLPSPAETFHSEMSYFHDQMLDLIKTVNDYKNKIDVLESQINELEIYGKRLEKLLYNHLSPELYPHAVKQWYQDVTGNPLNLEDPKTYNEKIQWMKVYNNDPRKTLLADKYAVRSWVKEKIGEKYLIPLLGVYNKAEDIDFEKLPNSFVLKANHGCGMNYIVREKEKTDLQLVRKLAHQWLSENYTFCFGYELQYNDIRRKIIAEEYIENSDGDLPDYKFWCFDGKCFFIELIRGRKDHPQMALYDLEWNQLPFSTGAFPLISEKIEKPAEILKMVEITERLAVGFPHVRVDLYLLDDGTIKFGEMTFSTSSGVTPWDPPEADLLVGNLFHLPDHSKG